MVKKTTTIPMLIEIINKRIERLEQTISKVSFDQYSVDADAQDIIERNLSIISDVCNEILIRNNIDKHKIIETHREFLVKVYELRNKLNHGYDHVDNNIVFNVATKELKSIKIVIRSIKDAITCL